MNFPYKTVRDIDVDDKRILMRVDYNVPLNEDGSISDDFRISASLPTIKYLVQHNAKVILISHLGRPKGEVNPKFSLEQVAKNLSDKLNQPVKFVHDCVGDQVAVSARELQPGEILLLENLRFHPEEEKNDPTFAENLAQSSQADLFVQDGFGVVHRPHASTAAITEFLPSVAGLLLEREYLAIKQATDDPNRPLTAVMGGAKISDKIPLVEKFVEIADNVIIGGAMANTFLRYFGHDIGDSIVESDVDDTIKRVLDKVHAKFGSEFAERFILPIDVAVSEKGDLDGARYELAVDGVHSPMRILDIGLETSNKIDEVVAKSGTVIWNGTLGMSEKPAFAQGSARLALALATHTQVVSVIGGGDTVDFVRDWDTLDGGSFTHVSTGGGAGLELMAGNILPGIAALMTR